MSEHDFFKLLSSKHCKRWGLVTVCWLGSAVMTFGTSLNPILLKIDVGLQSYENRYQGRHGGSQLGDVLVSAVPDPSQEVTRLLQQAVNSRSERVSRFGDRFSKVQKTVPKQTRYSFSQLSEKIKRQ